ncbi:hypothetical protein [Massilia suwonensis]|uniref:Secreted protein n=1 Tax=Massilia suwonensis TaxID=648895 RepID=A0ABW0MUH9_9BURK
MKHAKHSKPLRAAQIALVLLAALAAASLAGPAAAQTSGQTGAQSRPAQVTPAPAGPSYGPVLHPQPLKSEPGAQPERTPQAQEEKSGAAPPGSATEVDPSARPAPQPKDPAKTDGRKDTKKNARRSARRSSPQRVDVVPQAAASGPSLAPLPPPQPVALKPGPAQITTCNGGTCTDTSGASYNTGVGNAAVNNQGRLCTRTGNTMQCF